MPPPSAGILLFREREGEVQVLLIKPGGPFWRTKDGGAWMIPKGAIEPGEQASDAAVREFEEEIGAPLFGKRWLTGEGCCDTLTSHRGAIFPIDGTFHSPERFAIDWVQVGTNGKPEFAL